MHLASCGHDHMKWNMIIHNNMSSFRSIYDDNMWLDVIMYDHIWAYVITCCEIWSYMPTEDPIYMITYEWSHRMHDSSKTLTHMSNTFIDCGMMWILLLIRWFAKSSWLQIKFVNIVLTHLICEDGACNIEMRLCWSVLRLWFATRVCATFIGSLIVARGLCLRHCMVLYRCDIIT